MKRVAAILLLFVLCTGGAAACGDDGDDEGATTETTAANAPADGDDDADAPAGDDGDDGGASTASTNPDVVAYCDAVEEYVAKVQDAMGDPDLSATIAEEAQELSEMATALSTSGLSVEDGRELAACTQRSTSALTGG